MSGALCCRCPESGKWISESAWVVTKRHCNYSAFSGYRHVHSDYSEVHCLECGRFWRTKAKYVELLPDGKLVWSK